MTVEFVSETRVPVADMAVLVSMAYTFPTTFAPSSVTRVLLMVGFSEDLRLEPTTVGGQNSWELGGVEMEFLRII